MRKVLISAAFLLGPLLVLAVSLPWWYRTPQFCIQLLGVPCPQGESAFESLSGADIGLLVCAVGFTALLVAAFILRTHWPYYGVAIVGLATVGLATYTAFAFPGHLALEATVGPGLVLAILVGVGMLVVAYAGITRSRA